MLKSPYATISSIAHPSLLYNMDRHLSDPRLALPHPDHTTGSVRSHFQPCRTAQTSYALEKNSSSNWRMVSSGLVTVCPIVRLSSKIS